MDMSFKVDDQFHRAFKSRASKMGVSMKRLLEEAYALHLAVSSVDLTCCRGDAVGNEIDDRLKENV